MNCAVAAVSPPLFTPSPRSLSPVFCNPATPPHPSPPSISPPPSFFARKDVRNPPRGGGDEEPGNPKVATSDASILKRKRPTRIDIPTPILGIGDINTAPCWDAWSEVDFDGEGYSVCCKIGKRGGVMEDRYAVVLGPRLDSKQAFFGVFDGHGGTGAAEFAAKNLEKNIMREVSKKVGTGDIEVAVRDGYLTTDSEFLKEDIGGGTCCVTALVHGGDLVVSNAGDCRAVMSREGFAEALSVDHRPSLVNERKRIQNLGGYLDCSRGVWRVHGSLAVSRAIGDRHLKEWVIAEPETKVLKIRPECEFLILASDGLWDNVSNQEAVDIVRPLCVGVERPNCFSACKKLVDLSLTRGSFDDISVMVILLSQFLQLLD